MLSYWLLKTNLLFLWNSQYPPLLNAIAKWNLNSKLHGWVWTECPFNPFKRGNTYGTRNFVEDWEKSKSMFYQPRSQYWNRGWCPADRITPYCVKILKIAHHSLKPYTWLILMADSLYFQNNKFSIVKTFGKWWKCQPKAKKSSNLALFDGQSSATTYFSHEISLMQDIF